MTIPFNPQESALLDQVIQDFQGVLLSIHAACDGIDPNEPVRSAIDVSLDRADHVLEKWRDRVKSPEGLAVPPSARQPL